MSTETSTSFGELLREHRLVAGLTQEALAERAGMSARSIQALEHGESKPLRDTSQRLVSALGLAGETREQLLAAATPAPRRRLFATYAPPGAGSPSAPAYPGTLPVPATVLVGREAEVAAVLALLQRDEVRLLTLTGPGGVGKTRLAVQAATVMQEHVADGVVFVALAPLREPGLVLTTIAQAVGVIASGELPLAVALRLFLRGKQLLLVLDNFEHLLAAAPEVAALREACPGLRLLVTSRAALRLSGERRFPVPPLGLPESAALPSLDALGAATAVRLFVERAEAVKPDFVLTAANAPTVAGICARLDGLPLAIELAAARIPVLPPQALLAQLAAQPLRVLTGGARDLPARQRTLRDTVAWSHSLLPPAEQALFRRLASFVGSYALGAVEAVCRLEDGARDSLAGLDILAGLGSLVDLSLLQVEEATTDAGEPRFRMLETIREYGHEQLEVAGEAAVLRAQHAAYYLTWAERDAMPHTWADEQAIWLDRLDEELGNLRTALAWCVERGQVGDRQAAEQGLVVAGKFFHFWYLRGHHGEGRTWLARLLAVPGASAPTRGRGLALYAAAVLAGIAGERSQSYAQGEESVTILRTLGEPYEFALSLTGFGSCRAYWPRPGTTDLADARVCLEEAVALVQAMDRRDATWRVPTMCAHIYLAQALLFLGDVASARAHLEQALVVERAEELHWAMSQALQWRGVVAQAEQDLVGARTYLERALVHAAAIRDRFGMGLALTLLGDVAQQTGDRTAAHRWYTQAMLNYQPLGYVETGIQAWAGLAEVLLAAGEPPSALRLVSAATALTVAAGAVLRADVQARLDGVRAAAGQALSNAEQAAAWAAGQTMTLDQVIAEALSDADDERAGT